MVRRKKPRMLCLHHPVALSTWLDEWPEHLGRRPAEITAAAGELPRDKVE